MPANDLALLVDAARASGDIAMRFWNAAPQVWDKPDNAGPVTEADLAVDKMLHADLLAARPDYGWLSEETTDSDARLSCDRVFIVDPIDGTRDFIAGQRTWAHSIAVAEKGRVIAAVVYLPLHDKLYTATQQGALLNGQPIRASAPHGIEGATVLSNKHNLTAPYWPNGLPAFTAHFRSSLAYRLCLVAEGAFDAMLTFRATWEWDVAAGSLIAAQAGAIVTDQNGQPPTFNNPHPQLKGMIAAGEMMHTAVRTARG